MGGTPGLDEQARTAARRAAGLGHHGTARALAGIAAMIAALESEAARAVAGTGDGPVPRPPGAAG